MRILVISLPGDEARRGAIAARLGELGLDFSFFDAIDGRDGLAPDLEPLVDRAALDAFWRPLTDAEIACSLTHAFACRKVAEDLREPTIILEDDALVGEDFARLARSGLLERTGHELVLLYHNNTRVVKWPKTRLFGGYTLRVPLKAPWGAVAYYVSPAGAATIAARSLPITGVADWGFDILEMRTSCIVPRIVEHPPIDPSQTTMPERDFDIKMPDKKRRTVWQKALDPKYRRYFFRKLRAEWIYKP